jgi:hypothetical protein
LVFVLQLF